MPTRLVVTHALPAAGTPRCGTPGKILARLREATGLEQALRRPEPVTFDLAALMRLQIASLGDMQAAAPLLLKGADSEILMTGVRI